MDAENILRRIKFYGDDCLRAKSINIEEVTDEIKADIGEMLDFLIYGGHYGMAYSQLGKNLKMFVVNPQLMPEGYPSIFINPELRGISEDLYYGQEGCMSLYGCSATNVERYKEVKVKYQDLDNNVFTLSAEPLLSVVLQHEMDHLDGKLVIDRCSRLQRNMILKKIKKIKKSM